MSTEPSQHNTEIGKLIPLLKEKNIGYSPAFEKAYDDFSEVVSAYNKKYEQKMTTALKDDVVAVDMPPKPEQPESIGEQVRAAADVFSQLQGTAEGAGSSITPEVSVMPKVQEVKTADSADAAVVAPSAPEVKQEPQDTHTVSDAMRQLEAADPVPTEMPMRAESIEAPQDKKKVAIAVEADTAPKHQESPDETTKSVEPEERIFGTGQAIFSVPLSMPEAMEKKRAEYNKQRSEASEKKGWNALCSAGR